MGSKSKTGPVLCLGQEKIGNLTPPIQYVSLWY